MRVQIGPYAVVKPLPGEGVGTAYLGRHWDSGREAILIAVDPGRKAGPQERERLRAKLAELSQLNHQSLAPIHEMVEHYGEIFVAEDHLSGPTLAELEKAPMTLEAAMETLLPLLDGLACLHRHGLVHRAVRPENIVLSGGHAQLKRLGLAALAEAWPAAPCLVHAPPSDYLSPEQRAGASVDLHADIYSMAVVLYQALSRRLPHPAGNPPALQTLAAGIPAGVSEAVAIALDEDPRQRFRTATDFSRALTEGRVGFLPIRPASLPAANAAGADDAGTLEAAGHLYLPGEPNEGMQNLQLLAFAVAACILIGAGLLWFYDSPPRPPHHAPEPPPTFQRPVPASPALETSQDEPGPSDEPAVQAEPVQPHRQSHPRLARDSHHSEPTPKSPQTSSAKAVAPAAAEHLEIEQVRVQAREQAAQISSQLDAADLSSIPDELDALTRGVARYPVELQAELDQENELRRRYVAAQQAAERRRLDQVAEEAGWKTRLQGIEQAIDQGNFLDADHQAQNLIATPGVPAAVTA